MHESCRTTHFHLLSHCVDNCKSFHRMMSLEHSSQRYHSSVTTFINRDKLLSRHAIAKVVESRSLNLLHLFRLLRTIRRPSTLLDLVCRRINCSIYGRFHIPGQDPISVQPSDIHIAWPHFGSTLTNHSLHPRCHRPHATERFPVSPWLNDGHET